VFRRVLPLIVAAALAASLFAVHPAPACAGTWTPPPLKVAVVRSSVTDAWSAYNKPSGTGWARMPRQTKLGEYLKGRGWDVTFVGDTVFNSLASLEQYDVVVLCHVFCMDPTPSRNLQQYVARGGGLVSILASPRVAPAYDTSRYDYWPEHWAAILNGEAAEWGPMSEVYQMYFINDQFKNASGRDVSGGYMYALPWPGSANPVLTGARGILRARGYASENVSFDNTFGVPQSAGGPVPSVGFELTSFLKGNRNTSPFLTFKFTDANARRTYPRSGVPGGYPAAVTARYLKGRSVYFYCSPDDFLADYKPLLGNHRNWSGVPNAEAAMSLVESSLTWAGRRDGVSGPIVRGGKTWADVKVYGDGIYARQYLGADGNVSIFGRAYYRIYDPSGRLVAYKRTHVQSYASIQPGQVRSYAWQYRPGGPLKNGTYRVEVGYVYNYPQMATRHGEVVCVRRSQGVGIKTVPVGTKAAGFGPVTVAANPITPNADGWTDYGYVNYILDQPSRVTVRICDMWKRTVTTLVNDEVQTPGPHATRITGLRSDGRALGSGQYYAVVQARNTAGRSSTSPLLLVARFKPGTALGTRPALSSIAGSSKAPGRSQVSFTLSSRARVVVKVLDWAGEVATLKDGTMDAGGITLSWNGQDAAGRFRPAGRYRYYVFASGGGKWAPIKVAAGTVPLTR